jgi:uncharacterized membrane protein
MLFVLCYCLLQGTRNSFKNCFYFVVIVSAAYSNMEICPQAIG